MFDFIDDELSDEELKLFTQLVLRQFSQSKSLGGAELKNKCRDMLVELGKDKARGVGDAD